MIGSLYGSVTNLSDFLPHDLDKNWILISLGFLEVQASAYFQENFVT